MRLYRFYDRSDGKLNHSILFWYLEYRKRNADIQIEFKQRQHLDSDFSNNETVYFDKGLPLIERSNGMSIDCIIEKIINGTFEPLVASNYFEVLPSLRIDVDAYGNELLRRIEEPITKTRFSVLCEKIYQLYEYLKQKMKINCSAEYVLPANVNPIDFHNRFMSNALTENELEEFCRLNSEDSSQGKSYQCVDPVRIVNELVSSRNSCIDESRAAGIWIWDKRQEFGGRRGDRDKAIKEFQHKYPIKEEIDTYLGGDAKTNYELAKRCIEAGTYLTTTPPSRRRKQKESE